MTSQVPESYGFQPTFTVVEATPEQVTFHLTIAEAQELLDRALGSSLPDTSESASALQKLAKVVSASL